MANQKQSPTKGVPYRFQGNEAIGTETMSSAVALWGRDDVFRSGPLGPRRCLLQSPLSLLLQRIRSVHHEKVLQLSAWLETETNVMNKYSFRFSFSSII